MSERKSNEGHQHSLACSKQQLSNHRWSKSKLEQSATSVTLSLYKHRHLINKSETLVKRIIGIHFQINDQNVNTWHCIYKKLCPSVQDCTSRKDGFKSMFKNLNLRPNVKSKVESKLWSVNKVKIRVRI